jgi:hypothetical protein
MGDKCPMKEGMEYCPRGENCPMKRGAPSEDPEEVVTTSPGHVAISQYVPRDPCDEVSESDDWAKLPGRVHVSDFASDVRDRAVGSFAWVDADGECYLQHHDAEGKAVWAGVRSAMALLIGAKGGIDQVAASQRREVYEHLAHHYRQFDKLPPDYRFVEAQALKHCPDAYEFTGEGQVRVKSEAGADGVVPKSSIQQLLDAINLEKTAALPPEPPQPKLSEEEVLKRAMQDALREFVTEKTGRVF